MRLLLQRRANLHKEGDKQKKEWLQQLIILPAWKKATSVLLYAPLAGEVDMLCLLELFPQKRFFFPKIVKKGAALELQNKSWNPATELFLELYEWSPAIEWKSGPYGLCEPDIESWKRVEPKEVDLALIPGLAFDQKGGRLGRGKGFYDYLLNLSSWRAFKIGIAWSWQLVDHVPREPHDVLMDAIVTASTLFRV